MAGLGLRGQGGDGAGIECLPSLCPGGPVARQGTGPQRHIELGRRAARWRQGVELAKDAGRYTGRKANTKVHERIVALRTAGHSIPETARLAGCSESQVKRVWALHNQAQA